jgi:hypothetical protein
MDDDIEARINALVDEEHQLQRRGGAALSDLEKERLAAVEVQLDVCWDLLRQRRAKRAAGRDAADAEARPADVVEQYRQ